MRGCGTRPALRPRAIIEVEAGLPVFIAKGFIDGELAVGLIQPHEVEAMDAIGARRDDDAAVGCIPAGPMSEVVAGEGDARDLDRLLRIGDIERDDAINVRDALDEVVAGDGGDAACAAGKAIDQRGLRVICRNAGDMLKTA
jgi:hypothetical protein